MNRLQQKSTLNSEWTQQVRSHSGWTTVSWGGPSSVSTLKKIIPSFKVFFLNTLLSEGPWRSKHSGDVSSFSLQRSWWCLIFLPLPWGEGTSIGEGQALTFNTALGRSNCQFEQLTPIKPSRARYISRWFRDFLGSVLKCHIAHVLFTWPEMCEVLLQNDFLCKFWLKLGGDPATKIQENWGVDLLY